MRQKAHIMLNSSRDAWACGRASSSVRLHFSTAVLRVKSEHADSHAFPLQWRPYTKWIFDVDDLSCKWDQRLSTQSSIRSTFYRKSHSPNYKYIHTTLVLMYKHFRKFTHTLARQRMPLGQLRDRYLVWGYVSMWIGQVGDWSNNPPIGRWPSTTWAWTIQLHHRWALVSL